MNHQIPSVDQFLATSEPDEDDAPDLPIGPGMLWQLPPDPMERVASALEDIVSHFMADKQDGSTVADRASDIAGRAMVPVTAHDALRDELNEQLQHVHETLADVEAKHQTVLQVISDVEAALGKSKAAPALAAKAVIEAWRNPQVPEPEEPEGEMLEESPEQEAATLTVQPDLVTGPNNCDVEPIIEGHTRTPHPEGADFCRECSGERQEWIVWPCPAVSGEAQPLATGPSDGAEPVAQPEHNAPVEEWREYARALGYAGPEIDKANRSMIRTTLGIAQVP